MVGAKKLLPHQLMTESQCLGHAQAIAVKEQRCPDLMTILVTLRVCFSGLERMRFGQCLSKNMFLSLTGVEIN